MKWSQYRLFRSCLVQISTETLAILTDVFVNFLGSYRHIPVENLKLGHDYFLTHLCQFIILLEL
jgi:hypothetical protein